MLFMDPHEIRLLVMSPSKYCKSFTNYQQNNTIIFPLFYLNSLLYI